MEQAQWDGDLDGPREAEAAAVGPPARVLDEFEPVPAVKVWAFDPLDPGEPYVEQVGSRAGGAVDVLGACPVGRFPNIMVGKHSRVHSQTSLSVVDYCLHGECFRIWVELSSSDFFYGTDS